MLIDDGAKLLLLRRRLRKSPAPDLSARTRSAEWMSKLLRLLIHGSRDGLLHNLLLLQLRLNSKGGGSSLAGGNVDGHLAGT